MEKTSSANCSPRVGKALRKTKAALEFDLTKPDSHTTIKRYASCFDIEIYPKSVKRMLIFLRDFLVRANQIGVEPKGQGCRYWLHYKDRFYKFQIREITERAYVEKWNYYGRRPTGRLSITLHPPSSYSDNPTTWDDDSAGTLEEKLDDIVSAFPIMLETQLEKERLAAEKAKINAEKYRLSQIEDAKKQAGQQNLEAILKAARLWNRSREIAEFLKEAKQRLPVPYEYKVHTWIELCEKLVNSTDPFIDGIKPWEKVHGVKLDNEFHAFIALDRIDPHEELGELIEKRRPKSEVYYSNTWIPYRR